MVRLLASTVFTTFFRSWLLMHLPVDRFFCRQDSSYYSYFESLLKPAYEYLHELVPFMQISNVRSTHGSPTVYFIKYPSKTIATKQPKCSVLSAIGRFLCLKNRIFLCLYVCSVYSLASCQKATNGYCISIVLGGRLNWLSIYGAGYQTLYSHRS